METWTLFFLDMVVAAAAIMLLLHLANVEHPYNFWRLLGMVFAVRLTLRTVLRPFTRKSTTDCCTAPTVKG